MSISKEHFGKTPDGKEVHIFTIKNSKGAKVKITNYGAIVVSVQVPDYKGKFDDVVLGYDSLQEYIEGDTYFGAIIGRSSNRIKNASFKINTAEYNVSKNSGEHHLHGGFKGFSDVVWEAEIKGDDSLELVYYSPDKEEGFPGNLEAKVTYTFTEDDELKIDYVATTDKDTVVNMTNHSYFNLSGHASGDVLKHKVMINADEFTVIDKDVIPTGEIRLVKGTPLDFTKPTTLGDGIDSDYEQIVLAGGYDHNWILKVSGKAPEKAAQVYDEVSHRLMEVYTTKPGVQMYTANYLDGIKGKGGAIYKKWNAVCLETQYFPNGLEFDYFPSLILKVGDEYHHTTIYKFSVK